MRSASRASAGLPPCIVGPHHRTTASLTSESSMSSQLSSTSTSWCLEVAMSVRSLQTATVLPFASSALLPVRDVTGRTSAAFPEDRFELCLRLGRIGRRRRSTLCSASCGQFIGVSFNGVPVGSRENIKICGYLGNGALGSFFL